MQIQRKSKKSERYILGTLPILYVPLWKRDGVSILSDDGRGIAYTIADPIRTLQGRSFDGVDDYINCGSILADWNTDWTIVVWASLLTGVGDYGGIIGNRFGAGAGNWFSLGWNTDQIKVEFGPAAAIYINSGVDPRDSGFHQYILTRQGGIATLYVDLVSKGSLDVSAKNLGGATNDVYLGRWFNADQIWKGIEGEAIVHNRVLERSERQHIYVATEWRYR